MELNLNTGESQTTPTPLRVNARFASTGTFNDVVIASFTPTYTVKAYVNALIQEPSIAVLITALDSGYLVRKPILAVVRKVDTGFVASFVDANIHASGDTIDDAAEGLKSLIMDLFDLLRNQPPKTLGPGPKQQLSVLSSYIIKTEDANKRTRDQDQKKAKGKNKPRHAA